jgi:hypothetical protein
VKATKSVENKEEEEAMMEQQEVCTEDAIAEMIRVTEH